MRHVINPGQSRWTAALMVVLSCGVLLAGARAATQAADDASTDTLHVTSRLVVLDVQVLDKKSNVVTGLDQSQFSVYEDRLAQRIRDFESPKDHAMPGGGRLLVNDTADLANIGNAPVNVIVIDELNTTFSDIARAQQAIKRFLEKQPEVLPVPALLLASGASRIAVLHDFTQSRSALLESMRRHVTDVDFRALANQLNGGTMTAESGFAKTLGALSQVASSLRGISGHKNVIWIGTGFDKAYDLTSAGDSESRKIEDALQLVTQRMLDARMSVSTLDPAGVDATRETEDLASEALAGGDSIAMTSLMADASFEELARSTGGTVVNGRNDLDHLIADTSQHAFDFYTLTYSPASESDAAQPYRSIRVVMKDPNLHAVTRTGYFASAPEEAPVTPANPKTQSRELKFDLLSAGGSHLVYTGLQVNATKDGDGYRVLVEAGGLQWKPQHYGTRIAEVSIVGVAFNDKDKVLRQDAQEFKERIQSTDRIKGKLVGFHFAIALPPGAARIRFVMRDAASGKIGSVDLKP